MKKILLICALAIFCGVFFYTKPEFFQFLWGGQIISLPMIFGMLLILVQKETRSFNFLPKLISGALIISIFLGFSFPLIEYLNNSSSFNYPKILDIFSFSLILLVPILYGGLWGLVIKGLQIRLKTNKKRS